MPEYLAELYLSTTGQDGFADAARRVRAAASEMGLQGTPVRCLEALFVPEDETCLFRLEAADASLVRELGERAALLFAHVAPAIAG